MFNNREIVFQNALLGPYRYGFQNQEQDEELWEGAVSFKYRVEDARLGRFFSVDPLNSEFPWNSTYAFCENKLIAFCELEGLESFYAADGSFLGQIGSNTQVKIVSEELIKSKGGIEKVQENIHQIDDGLKGGYEPSEDHYSWYIDNSIDLGVENSEFIETASVAYGESSVGYGVTSEDEMNGIAYVYKYKNKVAYAKDKNAAVSFRNTDPFKRNLNSNYKTAISATIKAYRGIDKSRGADAWDGAEQATMDGKSEHNSKGWSSHAYQIGWTIHGRHFDSWKKAIQNADLPFNAQQHDAAEGAKDYKYNKGLMRYESTAQLGLTMFWKNRGTGAQAKEKVEEIDGR